MREKTLGIGDPEAKVEPATELSTELLARRVKSVVEGRLSPELTDLSESDRERVIRAARQQLRDRLLDLVARAVARRLVENRRASPGVPIQDDQARI